MSDKKKMKNPLMSKDATFKMLSLLTTNAKQPRF